MRAAPVTKEIGERSKTRRRWLWKNGKRKCHYCGAKLVWSNKSPWRLTVDHVIPRSKGGSNRRKNLVSACYPCNQSKGARLSDDIGRFMETPRG